MACSHEAGSEEANRGDHGTWMEKIYWEHFFPLHFCQILTPGTGFHNHLEIPKRFAKNSRLRLHPEVTLRGPGGATWRAIMNMTGDKVFLSGGWEEFARAYSLREGNILVFKYDRISVFDVLIFEGDSLCEKEAAYFVQKCENAEPFADPKGKGISTEADMEEPNDVQVHRATKKARKEVRKRKVPKVSKFSHLQFSYRRKKRTHVKSVSAKTTKTICQNTSVEESGRNDEEPHNAEADRNLQTEITPPAGNDIHWDFAPEPLHDLGVIHGGGWISEDDRPDEDATLNETTNEDAPPPAGEEIDGPSNSERRLVAIQGGPSGNTHSSNRNSPSGKDAMEMAPQATERSFLVTMRRSTVKRHFVVSIPKPWYKKHLSPRIRNAYLQVGDKKWLVKVYHQKIGARIMTGWERFARENRLNEQDVCLFNLTSLTGDTITLDVSIFRARPNTPEETETETEEYSSTI